MNELVVNGSRFVFCVASLAGFFALFHLVFYQVPVTVERSKRGRVAIMLYFGGVVMQQWYWMVWNRFSSAGNCKGVIAADNGYCEITLVMYRMSWVTLFPYAIAVIGVSLLLKHVTEEVVGRLWAPTQGLIALGLFVIGAYLWK